jgi:hypothetical protein
MDIGRTIVFSDGHSENAPARKRVIFDPDANVTVSRPAQPVRQFGGILSRLLGKQNDFTAGHPERKRAPIEETRESDSKVTEMSDWQ